MKKRSLRSSKEIFHKLRWNGGIPLESVSIGYMDRKKGMQEIAFKHFKPGGRIPFNRVYYFKLEQEFIWDRETRIDRVFGSGETAPGQRLVFNQVETAGIAAEFQPQAVYGFSSELGEWVKGSPQSSNEHLFSIKVVSYNVLRTDQEIQGVNHQRRIPQLIRSLDVLRPDVIALQEVTEPFREMLFRLAWVRENYWCTLPDSPLQNGQLTELILSRHAPEKGFQLSFSPAKKATGVRLLLNGLPLDVVTLHLPSDLAMAASERRVIYLRQLGHALKSSQAALILGDFNLASEASSSILPGFRDLWPEINPGTPGLTFDPNTNSIANALAGPVSGARLDRMLLKTPLSRFIGLNMQLIGNAPDQGSLSDHFGLIAELICDTSFTTLSTSPTTVETALVALPPIEKWANLQALRKVHDPRFERWMPHFTLLYGFLPEALFPAATVLLQQALADQVPFKVSLDEFGQFDQPNSTTLWLKPDPAAVDRLQALQMILQEIFPGCKDQQRHDGFRPHLTLATIQGPNRWRAGLLRSHLERYWAGIEFEIEAVALLSREGGGPFRVQSVVTLGDEDMAITPTSFAPEHGDLETAMGAYGLLTTTGSARQKSLATERLRDLLRSWSSSTKTYSIGLDSMNVHVEGQPLDLLVIGRRKLPEFNLWWESETNVLKDKVIWDEGARTYFMGDFEDLTVNIRYVHCPSPLPILAPHRMSTEQFNGFPIPDQKLMQLALELAAMRLHIGLHVPVFNVVVQALCKWAQKHGLREEEGFLFPETWALLVARVAPEESADRWLECCFESFSAHDWRMPFGDGPGLEKASMQVWSFSVPPQNKAEHIDGVKLQKLIASFGKALEEINSIHQSKGSWIEFLEGTENDQDSSGK